jgi:hypothetical protein
MSRSRKFEKLVIPASDKVKRNPLALATRLMGQRVVQDARKVNERSACRGNAARKSMNEG